MAKQKPPQTPLPLAAKIIIGIILTVAGLVLICVITAAIIFGPYLYKMSIMNDDGKYTPVDLTLTDEQKIADLDYMYDLAVRENPATQEIEQAYGISYDELYNTYRDYISGTDSDLEYLGYMSAFLAVMPGAHNLMGFPNYGRDVDGAMFTLTEVMGSQDIKDYNYTWNEELRDDVAEMTDYGAYIFGYVDGNYIMATPALPGKAHDEYQWARIVSMNGQDPRDLCFDFFERYVPVYDQGNDCFFRSNLIFNDGVGVKYDTVLEMRDGSTVNIELYDDPGFDMAFVEGYKSYPDLYDLSQSSSSSGDEDNSIYNIAVDEDRKLVYINITGCKVDQGDKLASDLQAAIDQVGAENIILDLRNNPGGDSSFVNKNVLPVVFSHDVPYVARFYGGRNDYTKTYYSNPFYHIVNPLILESTVPELDGDYFYGTEDFSVEGRATGDYNIYALTSQSTFSSGDIFTVLLKAYDKATVVGTNTKGEGICGSPFNCYLPNSHFLFVYVPTVSVEYPEDTYLGTAPDIYITRTLDEYFMARDMAGEGVDVGSFESRCIWDGALIKVLDMIDEGA
ncbi:MAG: hypothetical protein IKE53_09900 [Clostridiales bacterium]|nr:hypothetical protein [Clostridiales bacterium]